MEGKKTPEHPHLFQQVPIGNTWGGAQGLVTRVLTTALIPSRTGHQTHSPLNTGCPKPISDHRTTGEYSQAPYQHTANWPHIPQRHSSLRYQWKRQTKDLAVKPFNNHPKGAQRRMIWMKTTKKDKQKLEVGVGVYWLEQMILTEKQTFTVIMPLKVWSQVKTILSWKMALLVNHLTQTHCCTQRCAGPSSASFLTAWGLTLLFFKSCFTELENTEQTEKGACSPFSTYQTPFQEVG